MIVKLNFQQPLLFDAQETLLFLSVLKTIVLPKIFVENLMLKFLKNDS